MPGDYWQKFAGLRGFFGYWIAHPGKKLLFMGGEFGHFIEWNFDDSMDWHLVEQYPMHTKMLAYSKALNKFYVDNKAFWQVDFDWNGFQWIDCNDNENSIIALVRRAEDRSDFIVCVHNFTPEVRHGYRIGVPTKGTYVEVFNSDEEAYGGSGVLNTGDIVSEDYAFHGREQSIVITVPPLASTFYRLKCQSGAGTPEHEIPETVDAVAKKKAVTSKTSAAAAKQADTAVEKSAPKKRTTNSAEEKPAAKTAAKKTSKTSATKAEAAPAKKSSPKKSAKAKTGKSAEKSTEKTTKAASMTATKKKTTRKKTAEAEEKPKKTRAAKV